ncbi:MAG: nucleotidyltransferase family protein [Candidatus Riflebacteria bacterium]|nr:nucleotidyltransferase family protein [Candidatus Riflebacteria bacterium]
MNFDFLPDNLRNILDLVRQVDDGEVVMQNPDWVEFYKFVSRSSLAAYFYPKIKNLSASVPENIQKDFKNAYLFNLIRNTRFINQAKKIFADLFSAGIPVIVLKGMFLAQKVYSDISQRQMADIDVLVQRKDFLRTIEIIKKHGFEDFKEMILENILHENSGVNAVHLRKSGFFNIDLHFSHINDLVVSEVASEEEKLIWTRSQKTDFSGIPIYQLSIEDLLLHVCLHATNHHFLHGVPVRFLFDVSEILRKFGSEIDWTQLIKRSELYKRKNALYLSLYMTSMMTSAKVPEKILAELRPQEDCDDYLKHTCAKMFNNVEYSDPFLQRPYLSELRKADSESSSGIFNKIRLLSSRVFLPVEQMIAKYPVKKKSIKIYYYYGLRFIEIFKNNGFDKTVSFLRSFISGKGRNKQVVIKEEALHSFLMR